MPQISLFKKIGQGMLIGFLMIVGSFALTWIMVNQVKHSDLIASLELLSPEEAISVDGFVKVTGQADYQQLIQSPHTGEDVLYYVEKIEHYVVQAVERTRTITENGQERTETYYTYEPTWVPIREESSWSEFRLGELQIEPENARQSFNLDTLYDVTEDQNYNDRLDPQELVGVIQKIRTQVHAVSADAPLIVVGVNSNGRISSGGADGSFFISNKSHDEFLNDQINAEKNAFRGLAIGAWLLMTLGFTGLLSPLTKTLDLLPGLGKMVNAILFMIFGVASAIIIFIAYIGLKFWWLILLAALGGVGVWVWKKKEMKLTK